MLLEKHDQCNNRKILFIATGNSEPMTGGIYYIKNILSAFQKKLSIELLLWPNSFGQFERWIPFIFANLKIITTALKAKSPFIVYDSRFYAVFVYLSWLLKLLGFASITIYQGSHLRLAVHESCLKKFLRRILLSSTLRQSKLIIANSSITHSELVSDFGLAEDSISVIPPGFQSDNWTQPSGLFNSTVLKIFVPSRYQWVKGVDVIVNAIHAMKCRNIIVRIVGAKQDNELDYYADLKRSAKDLPIEFFDYKNHEEMKNMYIDSDIIVIPSRFESFGISVLEGLWHGCTVVCSDALPKEIRNSSCHIHSFESENISDLAYILDKMAIKKYNGDIIRFPYPLIDAEKWSWNRFQNEIYEFIINRKIA